MYKIHQQVKARKDLKNIWLYTYENFGADQADKYFDELESGMETIRDNPLVGVSCDYIRAGYRQFKVNEHYIFYRISLYERAGIEAEIQPEYFASIRSITVQSHRLPVQQNQA